MGMTSSIRYLAFSSCIASFIAMVLHAVAFGTRRWLVSTEDSPFLCIGFHEACFDNCYHPYCPTGDPDYVYDGCWWLYDYHFREIWDWLMPDWWEQCRNMAIANVVLITTCFILLVIVCVYIFLDDRSTDQHRRRDFFILVTLYVLSASLFTSSLLCLLTMTQFFANSFKLDYMPMPEKNDLGWSFWLEVIVCICVTYAAIGTLLAAIFKTLHQYNEKAPTFSDDMMMGRRY